MSCPGSADLAPNQFQDATRAQSAQQQDATRAQRYQQQSATRAQRDDQQDATEARLDPKQEATRARLGQQRDACKVECNERQSNLCWRLTGRNWRGAQRLWTNQRLRTSGEVAQSGTPPASRAHEDGDGPWRWIWRSDLGRWKRTHLWNGCLGQRPLSPPLQVSPDTESTASPGDTRSVGSYSSAAPWPAIPSPAPPTGEVAPTPGAQAGATAAASGGHATTEGERGQAGLGPTTTACIAADGHWTTLLFDVDQQLPEWLLPRAPSHYRRLALDVFEEATDTGYGFYGHGYLVAMTRVEDGMQTMCFFERGDHPETWYDDGWDGDEFEVASDEVVYRFFGLTHDTLTPRHRVQWVVRTHLSIQPERVVLRRHGFQGLPCPACDQHVDIRRALRGGDAVVQCRLCLHFAHGRHTMWKWISVARQWECHRVCQRCAAYLDDDLDTTWPGDSPPAVRVAHREARAPGRAHPLASERPRRRCLRPGGCNGLRYGARLPTSPPGPSSGST